MSGHRVGDFALAGIRFALRVSLSFIELWGRSQRESKGVPVTPS